MPITMRLHTKDKTDTLNGYIFSDLDHARKWVSQSFVKPDAYTLEEIEVGELHRCRTCGGSGYYKAIIKSIRKLTVQEFLGGEHVHVSQ